MTTDPHADAATHRSKLVDLACELLAVDTSNPPGATRAIVEVIEEHLADVPVETERFAVDPAKPNLLARLSGAADRTFLFVGHLDTVPFDETEWTRDPLGEYVEASPEGPEEDRIYGRGATDMKGAIVSMLFALRSFARPDHEPPVDISFAFVSDEEVGGDAGLPSLLEPDRIADGWLDADACLIGEPTGDRTRHSVTVADRGSIWLTLDATGDAAHGSRPVLGENAIDRLYDAVTVLRERFGSRQLDVDATMAPILEESVAYYAPTMGAETARDLFERPSINLGTIEGGDAINTVPASARAEIDVRLLAGVHTPTILEEIRECVGACAGVTIADVSWSIGTAEAIDGPLPEAVASTAETVTGERVYRRSATGGGDVKTLRNAGISAVDFAIGTDTVHAPDEFIPVDALVENAEIYAQVPAAWAETIEDSA
ncbi:M20 family metallopeptidase [Halopenitus sp. H-Gu1]|uniref:M20 family metallopeptidase n=1 Tax=Halopenitus sp. H-Gu1 TaxID=3242697 RepID=UPI00359ED326